VFGPIQNLKDFQWNTKKAFGFFGACGNSNRIINTKETWDCFVGIFGLAGLAAVELSEAKL